jgi:ankyrin repeat protein
MDFKLSQGDYMSFDRPSNSYGRALYDAVRTNKTQAAIGLLEATEAKSAKNDWYSLNPDHENWWPIHWAINHENLPLIEKLIQADHSRLTQKNKAGITPIDFAAMHKKWGCVKKIVYTHMQIHNAGIQIKDVQYGYGQALVTATKYNQTDCAILLISSGAQSNSFLIPDNGDNWYPLHWAVSYQNLEIIHALMKAEHNPLIQSEKKETPIMLASRLEYENCIIALTPKKPAEIKNKSKEVPKKIPADIDIEKKEDKLINAKLHVLPPFENKKSSEKNKEKKEIDELCLMVSSGDFPKLRNTLLSDQKYFKAIFNQRSSENLTFMEYTVIHDQFDMFAFTAGNKSYAVDLDAVAYIIGPKKINELLKKYKHRDYEHLASNLRKALSRFPKNYKKLLKKFNPEIPCLDSDTLKNLILNIAQGKLCEATLIALAKKDLFKETVLTYLFRLAQQGQYTVLDEILLSNEKSNGLQMFFGVKRGLTETDLIKGTLGKFICFKSDWSMNYKERTLPPAFVPELVSSEVLPCPTPERASDITPLAEHSKAPISEQRSVTPSAPPMRMYPSLDGPLPRVTSVASSLFHSPKNLEGLPIQVVQRAPEQKNLPVVKQEVAFSKEQKELQSSSSDALKSASKQDPSGIKQDLLQEQVASIPSSVEVISKEEGNSLTNKATGVISYVKDRLFNRDQPERNVDQPKKPAKSQVELVM